MMQRSDISYFDREQEVSIIERKLPHWTQPGTLCFMTWRLADSIPAPVMKELDCEVESLLKAEGLPTLGNWRQHPAARDHRKRFSVEWKLFAIWDKYVDAGHGSCALSKPEHAATVMLSLKHVDEAKCFLTDAVVMPNHVHLLAAFPN